MALARVPAMRPSGLAVMVEVQAAVREEVAGAGVLGGRELLHDPQGGVRALPLVAVDVAVDEDRRLVVPPDLTGPGGRRGRALDQVAHPLLGAGLAGGLRGGDGDQVEAVAAGRAARHLHAHPVPEALQRVQLRGDPVVRGEAQLQGLVAGVHRVRGEGLAAGVAAGVRGGGGLFGSGQGPQGRARGSLGRPAVQGGALAGDGLRVRAGGARGEQERTRRGESEGDDQRRSRRNGSRGAHAVPPEGLPEIGTARCTGSTQRQQGRVGVTGDPDGSAECAPPDLGGL